jgi:hypothetical protein
MIKGIQGIKGKKGILKLLYEWLDNLLTEICNEIRRRNV